MTLSGWLKSYDTISCFLYMYTCVSCLLSNSVLGICTNFNQSATTSSQPSQDLLRCVFVLYVPDWSLRTPTKSGNETTSDQGYEIDQLQSTGDLTWSSKMNRISGICISAPQSKNSVSTSIKHTRYIHLMSNFSSIHIHTKRLYVHMFDIVDIVDTLFSYGRGLIVC